MERAYEAWLASPSGHRNSWRVAQEHGTADGLVDEICREVRTRTLAFAPIRRRERVEPTNGKVRRIGIQSVKQQVCDYLAVTCMEPMLDARVGHWQVGGVRGRGGAMALRGMRRWAREGGWFAKTDVTKCYPSTSPELVSRLLHRWVGSADVLYVADALLATYDHGLEIGSYFSLRMELLVLSCAYHHLESLHKVRRGREVALVTHQMWHCDDVMVLARSKRDLGVAMRSLERYMADELGLSVKPWKACRVGDGEPLDMAGYQVRPGHVRVRGPTFLRARRAVRRYRRRPTPRRARRVTSYVGVLAHADCEGFIESERVRESAADAARAVSECDRRRTHGN